MSKFSPEIIARRTGGEWLNGAIPSGIAGFSHDTRLLKKGECFLALKSEKRDGHDFLNDAKNAGAIAAIVSKFVPEVSLPQLRACDVLSAFQTFATAWRREFHGTVFGITGSVGKTSTKDMLREILGERAFATEGNLNNFLGVPMMLTRLDNALHDYAVIEAGMSVPGEMETLAGMISPDIAVITNVQPAHLAGLGSLDAIACEKSALARALNSGGTAIFPASCLVYSSFEKLENPVAVSFADDEKMAPVSCRNFRAEFFKNDTGRKIVLGENGTAVVEFQFPQSSDGMAKNAALAAAAAHVAKVPGNAISSALARWRPSANRGEILRHNGRIFYLDCYNANPASVLDAAECFSEKTRGENSRLFVLAGMNELGADAKKWHRSVGGKLPLRAGDALAVFGGDAPEIAAGAVSFGFPEASVFVCENIEEVREKIARFAGAIFLKGSRAYALERALPVELQTTGIH